MHTAAQKKQRPRSSCSSCAPVQLTFLRASQEATSQHVLSYCFTSSSSLYCLCMTVADLANLPRRKDTRFPSLYHKKRRGGITAHSSTRAYIHQPGYVLVQGPQAIPRRDRGRNTSVGTRSNTPVSLHNPTSFTAPGACIRCPQTSIHSQIHSMYNRDSMTA